MSVKLELINEVVTEILIAESGHNLKEYASFIGISQPYLTQVLNGKRKPSPTVAHKIASGINLKVEDLFNIEVV